MASCCNARGCDKIYTARAARRAARQYRRKGLDRTAEQMVGFLTDHGIQGATVLEIGGGLGQLQLELLRRGAAHATNLELSSAYDTEAARLLVEAGMSDRVDRRVADLAVDPGVVEPADVVVLHRVVCCYPDYAGLLSVAADHAKRLLVFSYPRAGAVTRVLAAGENAGHALLGHEFRAFVHAPAAMLATLADHGHALVFGRPGALWQVAGTMRH